MLFRDKARANQGLTDRASTTITPVVSGNTVPNLFHNLTNSPAPNLTGQAKWNQTWRGKHPLRVRLYQRDYMRRRRANQH